MSTSKFVWTNTMPLKVATSQMVNSVALRIERDTKMRCPVDTGNLRRSYATQLARPEDRPNATVGTNVDYAMFVEFGTSRGRAQPHLGPALESARARYGR
jgi:HK97 gp10 family phage protein